MLKSLFTKETLIAGGTSAWSVELFVLVKVFRQLLGKLLVFGVYVKHSLVIELKGLNQNFLLVYQTEIEKGFSAMKTFGFISVDHLGLPCIELNLEKM